MNKILPLVFGIALFSGCAYVTDSEFEYSYEDEYWDLEEYEQDTQAFARGERFQDQATVWGTPDGVALASDDDAAIGMVGMVCSVETRTGNIQTDIDESPGDEVVVDGLYTGNGGGYQFAAIDGDQLTVVEFRGWSGWVETEVTVPGGDIAFMALTHVGRVLLQQVDGDQCRVSHAAAGEVAAVLLPGACLGLDANTVTGEAFVGTTAGTVRVGIDLQVLPLGPAGDIIAWSGVTNQVAIGVAGQPGVTVFEEDREAWTADVDNVVGAAFVFDGNLTVASATALHLYSPEGELLDVTETDENIDSMSASPDGHMLAVQDVGRDVVHLVRVD